MTVRSETRKEIASSQDDVYRYLSDVARWPEWAAGIVSCRVIDGGPLAPGSRLEQKMRRSSRSQDSRTLDVTSVEPPRRLSFAGTMGPSLISWGLDVKGLGHDRAEVLLWIEAERRGGMRLLPASVLRRMFRRVNQRELTAIMTVLESASEQTP